MKELEILNEIVVMKVSDFIDYINQYDIPNLEEIMTNSSLDDEGIQDCELYKIASLSAIAEIATIISKSKKLPYPRIVYDTLKHIPEELLSQSEFDKVWEKDEREAKILLAIANNINISYKAFKAHLNSI